MGAGDRVSSSLSRWRGRHTTESELTFTSISIGCRTMEEVRVSIVL